MKIAPWVGGGSVLVVASPFALAITLLLSMASGGSSEMVQASCTGTVSVSGVEYRPGAEESKRVAGMTASAKSHALAVIIEGRRQGVGDHGIVIALAVVSQESGFKIYANDGKGDDLKSDQGGIEASLDLPHEAVGTDHGSLGIFQQQWPWWGTMEELMNPSAAAAKFYAALKKVPDWESMNLTEAAQRVQRSAYPDAYADDEPLARELLEVLRDQIPEDLPGPETVVVEASPELCGEFYADGAAGLVHFPLPTSSGYRDSKNFGERSSLRSSWHTGNDYGVACGTPVFAVHAGVVQIETDQSWSGPRLVKITTGPGNLASWYAHMESSTVAAGDQVRAGQQIGTVGSEGNSTGCHLHLEIHPTGGSIYEDPVDPAQWLGEHLGKKAGKEEDT